MFNINKIRFFGIMFLFLAVAFFPFSSEAYRELTVKQFRHVKNWLIEDGFNKKRIDNVFSDPRVKLEYEGIGAYLGYSESKLNYDRFTRPKLIKKAKNYLRKHSANFERAEREYGVDRNIIAGIMLVETQFGSYLGKNRVFNTLCTMASFKHKGIRWLFWIKKGEDMRLSKQEFYPKADKKAPWAYNELKAFLQYTFDGEIDPLTVRGSFAGAMGIAQFMPSNLVPYGKDGNNDGHINLFHDSDAIVSIANYIKEHGWRAGMNQEEAHNVILTYNSSNYYARTVLEIARILGYSFTT